jgi:HEAT repeat protein
VAVLANSPSAEQREMAAHTLGAFDRWGDMTVVQGLITAARRDSVPQVRAASVRALGRMSNRSAAVLSAVHALRGDPDPLVRSEAERAYKILSQPEAAPSNARASVR